MRLSGPFSSAGSAGFGLPFEIKLLPETDKAQNIWISCIKNEFLLQKVEGEH